MKKRFIIYPVYTFYPRHGSDKREERDVSEIDSDEYNFDLLAEADGAARRRVEKHPNAVWEIYDRKKERVIAIIKP